MKSERALDPAVDDTRLRKPAPHAASERRLERELAVRFGRMGRV
jgi:hypothetical protein